MATALDCGNGVFRRHFDVDFHAAVSRCGSATNTRVFRHFHGFDQGEISVHRLLLAASTCRCIDIQTVMRQDGGDGAPRF